MRSFFSILMAVFTAIFSFLSTDGALRQLRNKGDISGFAETAEFR